MTEIKRYNACSTKAITLFNETEHGRWVKHDDHAAIVAGKDAQVAALQEQVRALAAENSELKIAVLFSQKML